MAPTRNPEQEQEILEVSSRFHFFTFIFALATVDAFVDILLLCTNAACVARLSALIFTDKDDQ